jgi:hypothetical protein
MTSDFELRIEDYPVTKTTPHASSETSAKQFGTPTEPIQPATAAEDYGTGRPFRDVIRARLID